VGNRVLKQYLGRGPVAEAAAREDGEKQAARAARRYAAAIEKAQAEPARDLMTELNDQVAVAIHSALMAAGFHQHARGRWRRKRHGKANEAAKQATYNGQGHTETCRPDRQPR